MARDIHDNIKAVEEINVLLLSAIGRPIGQPQAAVAELSVKGGITTALDRRVRAIVHRWLTNADQVTDLILNQKALLY